MRLTHVDSSIFAAFSSLELDSGKAVFYVFGSWERCPLLSPISEPCILVTIFKYAQISQTTTGTAG